MSTGSTRFRLTSGRWSSRSHDMQQDRCALLLCSAAGRMICSRITVRCYCAQQQVAWYATGSLYVATVLSSRSHDMQQDRCALLLCSAAGRMICSRIAVRCYCAQQQVAWYATGSLCVATVLSSWKGTGSAEPFVSIECVHSRPVVPKRCVATLWCVGRDH
jgi:hypothetical protein